MQPPPNPTNGSIWFNESSNQMYWFINSKWIDLNELEKLMRLRVISSAKVGKDIWYRITCCEEIEEYIKKQSKKKNLWFPMDGGFAVHEKLYTLLLLMVN